MYKVMSTKDLSTCFFLRNSIYSPAQQTKIKGTGCLLYTSDAADD